MICCTTRFHIYLIIFNGIYCVKLLVFEWQVDDPQIELICKVYNINPGNNTEIMEKLATQAQLLKELIENFKVDE